MDRHLAALLPALASCQAPAVLKPGCVLNRPRDPASTWHEKLRDRVPARSGSRFLGGGPWAPKHGRIRTERASLAQVSPGPRRARGHWALPRGTRESALAQGWAFDETFHGGTGRPAVPAPCPPPSGPQRQHTFPSGSGGGWPGPPGWKSGLSRTLRAYQHLPAPVSERRAPLHPRFGALLYFPVRL